MFRTAIVALFSLVMVVALLTSASVEAQSPPGTGYSITNPAFQDYFDHRGGARTLGQPISREFSLLGARVQFFQRAVLQQHPDGSVGPLNLLDAGLFPYIRFQGLTLPAIDPGLVATAPSPADPEFQGKALAFAQANVPDDWEGLHPGFYSTFLSGVTYQDAFPNGDADPALVPLLNLELWGLPTSRPAHDPNNGDFVYLRFQRGILFFDQSSGMTRWLPVGEFLKSLVTGRDLPPDLEQEAQGSRLLRQYDNAVPLGVANPSVLPDTNMFAAFEMDGVVVPTPVPLPTPVPATATPVPTEGPAKPDWIGVEGSEWFKNQTSSALSQLPDTVRDYIYKIVEVYDYSRFDVRNHTLYMIEKDAFIPSWRESPDCQIQWYAGWILHEAVHGEQYWSGRPATGLDAESEAWLRQRDFLMNHDSCDGAFPRKLLDVINKGQLSFTDFSAP